MTQANALQPTSSTQRSASHSRSLPFGLTWAAVAMILIVIVAAGLRLVYSEAIGEGNAYYTAAIENMLQSPSNFFYAVADAGGVTVDKPPVALWIQGIFGLLFGVTGFTVTLPSIIAGVLSVLLLNHLVKKQFGTVAGLISAFVLAITPVSVAVDRTNNMDSILIFVLLLATWAFIRAVETGKWRHVLLGAALVGLGFNVKMLQAYLILPALFAFYFFAANVSWRKKFIQLFAAGLMVLAVSASWALVVDLTPADQRPYVGGSENNSVLELAFGYNGLNRLLGNGWNNSAEPMRQDGQAATTSSTTTTTDDDSQTQVVDDGRGGAGGGGMFGDEIGTAGLTRLFETELGNEATWLLPFGLFSIGLLIFRSRIRLPLSKEHSAVVLWGGWLLTTVVFFTVSSFFHAYYLATMAPALAAMVGIGAVTLWNVAQERRILGVMLAGLALILTLGTQIYLLSLYDAATLATLAGLGFIATLLVGGLIFAFMQSNRRWLGAPAAAYLVLLLVIPAGWGTATALDEQQNTALPHAYAGGNASGMGAGGGLGIQSEAYESVLDYLEENNIDATYDVVVPSAQMGSSLVVNTDLDVLYLGGFGGQDQIYDEASFGAMIENGEIGLVLVSGQQSGVSSAVTEMCTVVEDLEISGGMGDGGRPDGGADDGTFTPPQPPQGADDGTFTPPAGMQPPGMGDMGGASTVYDCS